MDKKRKMNNQAKNNLFAFGIFLLVVVFSMYLIFAAHGFLDNVGGSTNSSDTNEDVVTVVNLTINNTHGLSATTKGNLTYVNITLPSGVVFQSGSNFSNNTKAGFYFSNITYSNSSSVLSWYNTTGGGLDSNYTNKTDLSFNVTAATPGQYNLTIDFFNTTGQLENSLIFNLTVNDTTAPILEWGSSTQGNNSNVSASTFIANYSATDNFELHTMRLYLCNATGSLNQTNITATGNSTWSKQLTFVNLTGGIYYINFTANDTGFPKGFRATNSNVTDLYTKRKIIVWDHKVNNGTVGTTAIYGDEDTAITINLTVNNTAWGFTKGAGSLVWWDSGLNITEVNVTVPSGLTFVVGAVNNSALAVAKNTSTIIYWYNHSGPGMINRTSAKEFIFTANATNPGNYTMNVTVWQNFESENLSYTTDVIVHVYDRTAPNLPTTFSCLPSSVYVNEQVTCTCSGGADDSNGVGLNTAYGTSGYSYTALPSTATAGTFSPTCTIKDLHGNTRSATTTYEIKSRGGASSSSSSSSSSSEGGNFWTGTVHTVTAEQFAEGFDKIIEPKQRIRVTVAGATHHVGLKSVTTTKAVIEISSDPVTIELDIGEDAKVDLDSDGVYDLYVVLNSIEDGAADLTVKELDEVVPEGVEGGVETGGDLVTGDEGGITSGEKGGSWWIAIIAILIIAAAVGGGVAYKKKK